jgi:hypothetical protein
MNAISIQQLAQLTQPPILQQTKKQNKRAQEKNDTQQKIRKRKHKKRTKKIKP